MIKDVLVSKCMVSVALASVLFIGGISPVIADDTDLTPSAGGTDSSSIDAIKDELKYLGLYFGYDITSPPPTSMIPNTDIQKAKIAVFQEGMVKLLLGTIPGSSIVNPDTNNLNTMINTVFKSLESNDESSHSTDIQATTGQVGANNSVEYPQNPVTQSIVNLIGAPSVSICNNIRPAGDNSKSSSNNSAIVNCDSNNPKYQEYIPLLSLGGLPNIKEAFNINTNLTEQLNSNSLISPLIYSSPNDKTSTQSNQAQQAQDFIRYVSYAFLPATAIDADTYTALFKQANDTTTGLTMEQRFKAAQSLSGYFVSLRSHAAQLSVGIANLYTMLAKRMPQQDPSGQAASGPTSEAYYEYQMATKRLYTPAASSDISGQTKQWVDKLDRSSPAAVQKEIAILLSEINYQLYLSRQQEERILLTNTAILFQIGHMTVPTTPKVPSAQKK